MEALLVTLLITVPIIVVGTLLYLWRNRASTAAGRRHRGALIAVIVFGAIGGLSVLRSNSEGDNWQSVVFTLLSIVLVLSTLVGELARASRRR